MFSQNDEMMTRCYSHVAGSDIVPTPPPQKKGHKEGWQVDLLVRAEGLNTGQVYTGRLFSGSGKIRVSCISVLQVSDQPNGFSYLEIFLSYFFSVKIKKLGTFII